MTVSQLTIICDTQLVTAFMAQPFFSDLLVLVPGERQTHQPTVSLVRSETESLLVSILQFVWRTEVRAKEEETACAAAQLLEECRPLNSLRRPPASPNQHQGSGVNSVRVLLLRAFGPKSLHLDTG